MDLHGPHDLRHTFATWLEDAGIPSRVIDEPMGHAGGRRDGDTSGNPMGRVYRETTPTMLARVTAALDERIGRAGDAYVYAMRDEQAYLQTVEDEKPEIVAEPPPDPAWFKCSFCRKTDRRVLFDAEYLVRDPAHDLSLGEQSGCVLGRVGHLPDLQAPAGWMKIRSKPPRAAGGRSSPSSAPPRRPGTPQRWPWSEPSPVIGC